MIATLLASTLLAVPTWTTPVQVVHDVPRVGWQIRASMGAWQPALPVPLTRTTSCEVGCITIAAVEEIPAFPRALGVAQVQVQDGRLVGCHIYLDSDTAWSIRPAVTAHELGHCLGLPHNALPDSIMSEHPRAGTLRPTTTDLAILAGSYTGGATP